MNNKLNQLLSNQIMLEKEIIDIIPQLSNDDLMSLYNHQNQLNMDIKNKELINLILSNKSLYQENAKKIFDDNKELYQSRIPNIPHYWFNKTIYITIFLTLVYGGGPLATLIAIHDYTNLLSSMSDSTLMIITGILMFSQIIMTYKLSLSNYYTLFGYYPKNKLNLLLNKKENKKANEMIEEFFKKNYS